MKSISIIIAACVMLALSTTPVSAQQQQRTAYLDSLELQAFHLASYLLRLAQAGLVDLQEIVDAGAPVPNTTPPPPPASQPQTPPPSSSIPDIAATYEKATIRETVKVNCYAVGSRVNYGHSVTDNMHGSDRSRGTLYRSYPDLPVTDSGVVTVFFHVTTSGKVIDPSIVEDNTTLSSTDFRNAALNAARNTVYEPSSNGDEFGFVSYVFEKAL